MAQTETQVAALELERVIPKFRTLFDRDDKFFSTVQKRDVEKISNRQMRVPLELRPGGSFGYWNPDGGDLGRGGGPTYDKAVLSSVFLLEAMEYTKLTDYSTNDTRKAIVSSVRRLTATAFDEFRRQLDANSMGDGSGTVGVITTVTVNAGYDTYDLTTDGFGARLVRYGQTVQVFDTTLATLRGSGVITFLDVVNKQIQVTPNIANSQTGDKLVVNGITSPASIPALLGVAYQHSNASTGNWLGISRSANPEVRANGINAASSALTLPLPRLAINAIGNRVGIDNNFKPQAWMHPAQKQAYEQIGQLVSIIHKQAKEEGLDMYFDSMQMAGAPVKTSFNWDMTRIDFILPDVWGRGETLPLGFYTTDGRKIFEVRGTSGGVVAADIFYLVLGTQFFVNNPAACSYIYSLAVPSGY